MGEIDYGQFKSFDRNDCLAAIDKHGLGESLWANFWNFAAKQSEKGAPYCYVKDCADILEIIWNEQIELINRK